MDYVGTDLFTSALRETLKQFEEVENFGSLIRPALTDVDAIMARLNEVDVSGQLFLYQTHEKVLQVLDYVRYLSPRYHVVIANPPYMGGKGMNPPLKAFLEDNYKDYKSDLFSAFIVRNTELTLEKGQLGFMTPFVWMFISSYEKLRQFLINKKTITSLIQLEYSGFDGATVPICTFTLENAYHRHYKGGYVRLSDFKGADNQPIKTLEAISNPNCGWFYRASASDFKKIPGSSIAYWFSQKAIDNCENYSSLSQLSEGKSGMSSCNSDKFLRQWHEISLNKINRFATSHLKAKESKAKWFPYNKGGGNRRWFGYNDVVINWANDGKYIKDFVVNNPKDPNTKHWSRRLFNLEYFFKKGFTWSAITSSRFSCRIVQDGVIPGTGSKTIYDLDLHNQNIIFSLLNSTITSYYLSVFSPTLNYEAGDVGKIPIVYDKHIKTIIFDKLLTISKQDWDSFETSWDFTTLPLLAVDSEETEKLTTNHYPLTKTIEQTYTNLRQQWAEMTLEMQKLEEENNRIFIEAYGLQEELTPEVPLKEITLTCNPHYRYDSSKTNTELEALLLADTTKEFISYSVGCMFGRYSLDKQGLILANQGETIEDYLQQIPQPTYTPTKTNIIPILDSDWFSDDITEQFRQFLRVTFGEANYQTNLKFIEEAIDKKIGKYFQSEFYSDHIKRYKKRPIYWLFSSPKGSFNALIYLHRYRPDTVSIVLNEYLREYRGKLEGKLEHLKQLEVSADVKASEKTKALKEITQLTKIVNELNEWDRTILYPLAIEKLEIDLDNGVKVNYPKFGKALKEIKGLEGKED
jgi:type II restriction/modification system DNA methylase subunit YeeA